MTMQELTSYRYCNGTKFKVFNDDSIHTLATLDFYTGECMDSENGMFYSVEEIEQFIFPAPLAAQNNGFNRTPPEGVAG